MTIEIIPRIGGQPLRLEVAQFILFNDDGTPIAVAGEFGPRGTVRIAHAGENSFPSVMNAFGYGQHKVKVDHLEVPPPPSGARQLILP